MILAIRIAAFVATFALSAQAAGASTLPHLVAFAQPAATGSNPAGEAFCKQSGGVVEVRTPVFGTNNPQSQWLILSGTSEFCQYTKKSDGSRIHLLLTTLMATKPTLAALAYYAKVPLKNANCTGGGNPASCYCTYLGGSDQFGGTNFAGGAWVLQNTTDVALEACIFPDLSSIDSWGLTYHSGNIVRGIDLAKVLHYHKH